MSLAIITGASRGIGKEAAYYFAENGFDVALIATNEALLQEVSEDLTELFPIKTSVHAIDVSDSVLVNDTLNTIASDNESIDVLLNCAGIIAFGTSAILPNDFNQMVDVNLRGVYNMVHAVVPYMKKQRSGYIFNLSSYAGKRPLSTSGAYCMTKYGVLGYSQSLSLELTNFNIKVTAICPSVVDTEMTQNFPDFPDEEKILCKDILQSIDYLLTLSPNAYVDEITIKSTFLLKKA